MGNPRRRRIRSKLGFSNGWLLDGCAGGRNYSGEPGITTSPPRSVDLPIGSRGPIQLHQKGTPVMSTTLQQRLDQAVTLHGRFTRLASNLQSGVLLFLRLTWGWQLAQAGYGHLTHIENTVEAFRGWGVPLPVFSVYVSGITELAGGTLLMLGLAARLISVPLFFNFLVAYATASRATLVQLAAGPNRLEAYDAFINDSAFTVLALA